MKIAVASDDNLHVSGHIGRVNGFIIYECSEGKILGKQYLENTFTNHGRQGRGEHHHGESHRYGHERLIEALKGVDVLIFTSGGWRLVEDLEANGIKPFMTDEENADSAVEKYLAGQLIEREDNVCHHGRH
ncbi:NifB/NifX family molybdenum-iron cluster-binding protein [Melioribacter sp. OK-6-Me]|uniref:NifB/NifX family molybdenum-iron cluster-binding protein n=1 Tax=unclassified Melioribacter TaxID=2627329 RepID=UPI003EDAD18A